MSLEQILLSWYPTHQLQISNLTPKSRSGQIASRSTAHHAWCAGGGGGSVSYPNFLELNDFPNEVGVPGVVGFPEIGVQ